jgi:hypothetical protein
MRDETLITAIQDIGGISRKRIDRSGLLSEWLELPGAVRSQVFRTSSTQDPDEVAAQLREAGYPGITDGDCLLQWLLDPRRRVLTSKDAGLVKEYEAEIERLRREVEELRSKLEKYEGTDFEIDKLDDETDFHKTMASAGGKARARRLTAEQRSAIARKAAEARYNKPATQELCA